MAFKGVRTQWCNRLYNLRRKFGFTTNPIEVGPPHKITEKESMEHLVLHCHKLRPPARVNATIQQALGFEDGVDNALDVHTTKERLQLWQRSVRLGVLTPTSGSVTVAGHEIGSTAARKSVGFCPQFDVFFTDLTVSEHLRYFSLLRGVDYSKTSNNVKQLLSRIELEDKVNAFPDELSGGMKRKLSLALALVTGPSVLILDEPTTGMDPDTRRTIWQLVQELRGKKTTIVMSTHDMEEADVLGDRIIVMYSGRVVCNGSPSFLKNACGVGYELNIEKAQTGLNVPGVLAVVREVAPEATVKAEKEGEVCIALHTFKRAGFPRMFNVLETKGRTELGVQSLGVSVATMKDAYIK
ncbi:hypothetical protein HPB48_010971 [Haemaphysalis longicornis]|uniref:ABC transporter domain-containing protein n=1 Tax=Haemaphysalis longicornis TaxID=44386 RepID=A0A9J6GMA7_HAELO|nr:hypothetical protein HPB48_010971 [Haemaphysalis longicornis]